MFRPRGNLLGGVRDHFPALRGLSYLNAAGEGPLPRAAVDALARAACEKERPESIGGSHYYDRPEEVRERIALLINASADEIALTGSTSAGIGIAARELPISPGGEVLLLEGQFPANVFPWYAAERRGAVIRRVPIPPAGSSLQAVRSAMNPRTAIVAVDWVGFATGVRAEIEEIGRLCRASGAIFVLDAAQCIGALSLDVRSVEIDLVAAPGHKWLLGPPGTGFLFVARRWIERIHPYNAGWVNLAAREGFRNLLSIPARPPDDASRFECGTPQYLQLAAWLESLDLLLSIGAAEVQRRVLALAAALREAAARSGLEVLSRGAATLASPIVVTSAGSEERTLEVYRALLGAGVITAMREGALRLSPHIYNDESDVDRFETVTREALREAPSD